MSGTPSFAAKATSGVCEENGIADDRRSSASSAKEPTGSSTFAMSNGSRSESGRLRRPETPAHVRVDTQLAIRANRGSHFAHEVNVFLDRVHGDLSLEHRRVVLLHHPRAERGDIGRRFLAPGPVREVLA